MKLMIILFVALLTGCSTTVPVVAKFPEVPKHLMVKCPQLNKVNDDAKLSDIAKTITVNYSEYYACAVKSDAWIEWYGIQKTIFEGLK
jgi:hypothetical protein